MSETLKPWYAIATPHEDIREGRLVEAVFAANVWAVVQNTAPEVSLDPSEDGVWVIPPFFPELEQVETEPGDASTAGGEGTPSTRRPATGPDTGGSRIDNSAHNQGGAEPTSGKSSA